VNSVGRNDPCPCGSGRKFKKCCLGKSAAESGAFTAEERRSALNEVFRFSARPEFAEDQQVADLAFWADRLDDLTDDEVKELVGLEQSQAAMLEWFAFDFRLASGRMVVDLFLDRHGDRLRSGELRYLERMRRTHLRPYEVAAVKLDEGLALTDLWANKRIRVRERAATHQLVRWDVIAARIMLGPRGDPELEGAPYLYPPSAKEPLLKALRRAHRDLARRFRREDETACFKRAGMLYHLLWLDHVALRPLPALVTAEGDKVVLARVVFDVRDKDMVDTALAGHPDLVRQDEGSYVWLEAGGAVRRRPTRRAANAIEITSTRVDAGGAGRRSLGTVILGRSRLVLEATSRPRAEQGRAMIEALAGAAVTYRATRYEDVGQAMKRRPAGTPRDADIPHEVVAQLTGQFYEAHYRKWADEPLPALGGRTPREAAGLESARPKLVALLKVMENMSERERREGRPAYDFGWMWEELGLERPGSG
jgi:hypothetical protein